MELTTLDDNHSSLIIYSPQEHRKSVEKSVWRGPNIKFILYGVHEKVNALLFSFNFKHTNMADLVLEICGTGTTLVGGGLVMFEVNPDTKQMSPEIRKIQFNSDSMLDKYGFDRPTDQQSADTILQELRSALEQMLQEIPPSNSP